MYTFKTEIAISILKSRFQGWNCNFNTEIQISRSKWQFQYWILDSKIEIVISILKCIFWDWNSALNIEIKLLGLKLGLASLRFHINATLHVPKMWAVVQTSFLQTVHTASVKIFHCRMLLDDRRISKVEARQKATRLTGNANKDFHEKPFWT